QEQEHVPVRAAWGRTLHGNRRPSGRARTGRTRPRLAAQEPAGHPRRPHRRHRRDLGPAPVAGTRPGPAAGGARGLQPGDRPAAGRRGRRRRGPGRTGRPVRQPRRAAAGQGPGRGRQARGRHRHPARDQGRPGAATCGPAAPGAAAGCHRQAAGSAGCAGRGRRCRGLGTARRRGAGRRPGGAGACRGPARPGRAGRGGAGAPACGTEAAGSRWPAAGDGGVDLMERTDMIKRMAAVAVLVSLLAGCSSFKSMFAGKNAEAKKAAEPAELVKFKPTIKPRRAWSVDLGDGERRIGARQGPAVADGRVYAAAAEGRVLALDLQTGKRVWEFKAAKDEKLRLTGGPGAGNGLVVVGGLDGAVIALDAQDGSERWRAKVRSEIIAAPTVSQGLVLVRSNDGRITAFDAASGEQRWYAERELPSLTVRGNASLTPAPGLLFAGNDDG